MSCRVMSCHRSSGRYRPSCLGAVPLRGLCIAFGLRHGPRAGFRAVPRPIKPTTAHFHQYFHQLFIIFANITINNIYTSHNYTNNLFLPDRYQTNCWNRLCPCRAACRGGGPDTTWSLRPARPGPVATVPCWAKSPGHRLHGHRVAHDWWRKSRKCWRRRNTCYSLGHQNHNGMVVGIDGPALSSSSKNQNFFKISVILNLSTNA